MHRPAKVVQGYYCLPVWCTPPHALICFGVLGQGELTCLYADGIDCAGAGCAAGGAHISTLAAAQLRVAAPGARPVVPGALRLPLVAPAAACTTHLQEGVCCHCTAAATFVS